MLTKDKVKQLALDNGFKLKQQPNGSMDLNPYVYQFAEAMQKVLNDVELRRADAKKVMSHPPSKTCEDCGVTASNVESRELGYREDMRLCYDCYISCIS